MAESGVQVFSDSSSWQAHAGNVDLSEDFQGFASDVDFSFGFTGLPNGFSLSHSGDDNFRNLIDVPPIFVGTEGNGTSAASLFVDGDGAIPDIVTLSLNGPASALSFDLVDMEPGTGEGSQLSLIGVSGNVIDSLALPSGSSRFVGYVIQGVGPIASIRFSGPGDDSPRGEGFFLDNVSIVSIPEPSSLVITSFCGLCYMASYLRLAITVRRRQIFWKA